MLSCFLAVAHTLSPLIARKLATMVTMGARLHDQKEYAIAIGACKALINVRTDGLYSALVGMTMATARQSTAVTAYVAGAMNGQKIEQV
eukprot:5304895-Prymnesium_polylepis.2